MNIAGTTTLAGTIFAHASRQPAKEALWCDGVTLSYAELAARAAYLSRSLFDLGVKQGAHIGVALPNSVEFALLLVAAADLGAVLVPVSPALPATAMQRAFTATDVTHVVAPIQILRQLREECPAFMQGLPGVCIAADNAGGDPSLVTLSDGQAAPLHLGCAEDAYILTMTSGSTGDPKPIVFEQRTKLVRAQTTIDLYSLNESERILAATPMYHSLAQRLTLMPLLLGGTAVILPRFSVPLWLETIATQAVTFTIAVSSQLAQIARDESAALSKSSLRCIVSSSALLETPLKQRLAELLRCEFHECYGTSETATATDLAVNPCDMSLASVGRALPGVDLRIVDGNGNDVPIGGEGEIVCRTPLLFAGYYKRPELTRQAMLGDYFRTGDAGRLDGNGYLFFRGRLKEIIITGGINVYPKDIEEAVETLPWIAECAAFALPDEGLGEIVALAVVARPGMPADVRGLKMRCVECLADYQIPRKIFVLDDLPRNAMGKILRRELPSKAAAVSGAGHA
ncbi:MAG TPA: class I adenylate-forming enzyme family protein [Rhodocyclaceae bacterium]|jgi:long-chain acyl-CoA synthetase|nr:class I adenylate-forming enzyme family protein [Rhodocyclaceae bacterium]